MSDESVGDQAQAQLVSTDSIPEPPQIPNDSKGFSNYRRRRPKRRIAVGGTAIVDQQHYDDDQWYDAPYQLISSGYITPMEDDISSSISQSPQLLPLPTLLYERELYGQRRNNHQYAYRRYNSSWMHQMRFDKNTKHVGLGDVPTSKRFYLKQALKFCDLRTSHMDAILGIAPNGNYVVAVDKAYRCHDDQYLLYLRFCGIPSCHNPTKTVAPVLMSVPLRQGIISNSTDWYWGQLALERCPLRVWLSTDERFGSCLIRSNDQNLDKYADVVLFPLPNALSSIQNEYKCYRWNNVHVPCLSKQDLSPIDDCNLLIRVPCFPNHKVSSTTDHDTGHWVCDTLTGGIMAHLFLMDVEDGFSLTWIRESAWEEYAMTVQDVEPLWEKSDIHTKCHPASSHDHNNDHSCLPGIVRATKECRIVIKSDNHWQPMIGHPTTDDVQVAATMLLDNNHSRPFTIAFVSFFSVASLLLDILKRRPRLVSPRFCEASMNLPSYTYHLVQVKDGRAAEVLLIFAVGPIGKGCLGVYVEVDLFTQDYREMEWMKHPAHDSPPPTCAKLAFERRKGQAGINSVQGMTSDSVLDILYPDCVSMDNRAIRRNVPTMFMSARSADVTISYL